MILGILQARFSSLRLPGKVLKPIKNKPMLIHQIERLENSQMIDKLIVATSDCLSDDVIEEICLKKNIAIYRGSLNNVLDRFYNCAIQYKPKHIVRLTGDCPLIDPYIVDQVIKYHLAKNSSYTSNCHPPTFPDGLDVEIFVFSQLVYAWQNAKLKTDLEHVTPFIRNNIKSSSKSNYESEYDFSFHRWTVDELQDFIFVREVFDELYENNPKFNMQNILELLLQKPELSRINNHISRNEGSR